MRILDEKALSRVAMMMNPDGNVMTALAFQQMGANARATYQGKAAPYPDALPTQEQAREFLRGLVAEMRILASQYVGEDLLTDAPFGVGAEIYYGVNPHGKARTFIRKQLDEFLRAQ